MFGVEVASFGLLPFSFSSTSGKPSPSVSTVFGVEVASFGCFLFLFLQRLGNHLHLYLLCLV
ncbi:hypothetical protein H1220_02265 [Carnobacteriaceae bacterium zg-84]|nr:hypothetical protein H1220_02265 [Carnobacteriaceae bacterium zg-84]